MTRLFLATTASLFLLLVLVIGGTRLAARRDPPDSVAALLPDPACPAPCWQGLRPGTISSDALHDWLHTLPDGWHSDDPPIQEVAAGVRDRWRIDMPGADPLFFTLDRIHSPLVDRLIVSPPDLRLGEVIAALGTPDYVDFMIIAPRATQPGKLEWRLYYERQRVMIRSLVSLDDVYLYPDLLVDALIYEAAPWGRPVLAFDWRGFGSFTRYYPGWR